MCMWLESEPLGGIRCRLRRGQHARTRRTHGPCTQGFKSAEHRAPSQMCYRSSCMAPWGLDTTPTRHPRPNSPGPTTLATNQHKRDTVLVKHVRTHCHKGSVHRGPETFVTVLKGCVGSVTLVSDTCHTTLQGGHTPRQCSHFKQHCT